MSCGLGNNPKGRPSSAYRVKRINPGSFWIFRNSSLTGAAEGISSASLSQAEKLEANIMIEIKNTEPIILEIMIKTDFLFISLPFRGIFVFDDSHHDDLFC
jgi:hypothetical protein